MMSPAYPTNKSSALPRVLVLDDDQSVGRDLEDILRPRHFRVIAPSIGGPGLGIEKEAESLARQHRPHVIVLDLRLSDHYRDDRGGLSVLARLPDVPCIIYSNWVSFEIDRLARARHENVQCIEKHADPDILVNEVSRAARASCASRCRTHIRAGAHCDPAEILVTLFPERTDLPPGMLDDLLHRLFPRSNTMTVERLSTAHPASAPASRGHSVVCKVMRQGFAPFVVKFGPADKIEREARRYADHVNDRLSNRYHSEMDRSVTFWEVGAASYRFIGSGSAGLPTFSALYESQDDPDALLRPLRHFFADIWGEYYRSPLSPFRSPLYEAYNRALRLRLRLRNPSLRRRVAAHAGSDLRDPLLWIEEHSQESWYPDLQQVITHGDLHGDNLFVDDDHAWAIDFERTGPGHILRDFAELEVDILTRLAPVPTEDPTTAMTFYRAAVSLAPDAYPDTPTGWAETVDGRKALQVVDGLRRLSREVTRQWRPAEYLWALLLDTAFVLSLVPPNAPQWRRSLLLAAELCRQLE